MWNCFDRNLRFDYSSKDLVAKDDGASARRNPLHNPPVEWVKLPEPKKGMEGSNYILGCSSGDFTETFSLLLKIKDVHQGNSFLVRALVSNRYYDNDGPVDLDFFKVSDLCPVEIGPKGV
ncbi:hypothetical protein ACHQM5_011724 [Ranunculus cassubicifolius]